MHPRYTLSEMAELWSEESKFNHWLEVEIAFLKARAEAGDLDHETLLTIAYNAKINVARIEKFDKIYHHDLIAFVSDVQESLRESGAGEYAHEVHRHLTSYDTEDPAVVLMLRKAVKFIMDALTELIGTLEKKALEHKWTYMIGRTHGQFAEPTTFGHMLLVFTQEMLRNKTRLEQCLATDLSEGKIAGAIGNYCGIDPNVSIMALDFLGLKPAPAETQILGRDRFASVLSAIAITGAGIERMTRCFWELMRSDTRELEEARGSKQRGSSHMAYKKNPIFHEQGQGLPRLLRGYLQASLENIETPDFRAIEQSSVERHILPGATSLLHYMLVKLTTHVQNLLVFPERMKANLDGMYGIWASQQIRSSLMDAGVSYDDAYLYLQKAGFQAWEDKVPLQRIVSTIPISESDERTALTILGEETLASFFDVHAYIECGIDHLFTCTAKR